MKLRYLFMLVALLISAWLAFFSDKTPTTEIAEAVKQKSSATESFEKGTNITVPTEQNNSSQKQSINRLLPRQEIIGTDRNKNAAIIFKEQSWTPPPPPPVMIKTPPIQQNAPPLPFTFLGKKFEDGAYEVYLAIGDRTFIVRDKSIIEDTYQVDAIRPPVLTLTYIPLKQVQTIAIGNAD